GTNGLAIGDIGWCKDPFTSPSTIRFAAKGFPGFQSPAWTESWFPDAFAGTMAQLLIALENGTEPAISGRDNLKTMALVEAAYRSAKQFGSVDPREVEATVPISRRPIPKGKGGFFQRFFPRPRQAPSVTESKAESLRNFTPRAQQVLALARKEAE